MLFRLGISAKKALTITVSGKAKARSGLYLDGNYYTGKKTSPGADFVLDVVPEQVTGGRWTPSI